MMDYKIKLLLQDLCLLINAEPPCWLIGIQEMTRTLGLELLESVLAIYPSIFVKVCEYIFEFCCMRCFFPLCYSSCFMSEY